MSDFIGLRKIITFHGEIDGADPELTVTHSSPNNEGHCIVGFTLSEPGYGETGVDLTALEVRVLISTLQGILDRA